MLATRRFAPFGSAAAPVWGPASAPRGGVDPPPVIESPRPLSDGIEILRRAGAPAVVDATHETSGSESRSGADDPRAGALEVEVARERARAAMFGGAHEAPRIGRFLLLAPIGRGGMGSVFAAYDPQLDRRIAIKLVRSQARDPAAAAALRERTLREARAMAKVSHPNVVAIHEAGIADDVAAAPVYIAMELVEGATLRQWLAERTRSCTDVVGVHVAAARGLAAVHAAGLVHRDFKPDNAMIDAHGRVRVMDFGLARALDESGSTDVTTDGDTPRTATTRPAGTPGYMAPEQLCGDAIDHRADQYALCVSLYEALWGRRPSANETADPPRTQVPARVRAAILRGIAVDRERRFASMDALADALAPPRHRRSLALGLALAGTIAAAILVALVRPQPCPRDELAMQELAMQELAIEQSFDATGLAYAHGEATRSIAGLRAWAEAWDDERERACLATRVHATQSEGRLDLRMRCLERLRREAVAVARELSVADADTVDNATTTVERLVAPVRCDDDAVLDAHGVVPGDAIAAEVARIDGELARGNAMVELGHAVDAVALVEPLVTDARASGFEPTIARAEVFAARARAHAGGDPSGVADDLRTAYFDARRTSQAEDAARAALDLAGLVSTVDAEIEVARLWLELARSDLEIHRLAHLEGIALDADAAIAQASGEWERLIELGERQLAWIDESCPACDQRGLAHRSIAVALDALGRPDAAVEHARAALDDELGRHDAGHPHVAEARRTLGQSLGRAGRAQEAIEALSAAVDSFVARYGEDDLDVAVARATLARVMLENGRADEAIALLERTLQSIPQHSRSIPYAAAQHTLGSAYYWGGRLDDAARALQAAIEVQEALFPEGHPNTAVGLGELANVDFDRGRMEEALAGYQRALAMRRATVGADDPLQARLLQKIDTTLEALGRAEE